MDLFSHVREISELSAYLTNRGGFRPPPIPREGTGLIVLTDAF